jgi:hypothetical protein
MDQNTVVRNLAGWLQANRWHPSLKVLYDLASYGVHGESKRGAFYMGEKSPGQGRRTQVAQTDILVTCVDTRTIELSVEVDFRRKRDGTLAAPSPKTKTGLLLTPAAADCYTPSNEYRNPYTFRDTVIAVVTAYPTRQALEDDRAFARELFTRFHVAERGVRELCVCGGATEAEIERSFQEMVRTRFWAKALLDAV